MKQPKLLIDPRFKTAGDRGKHADEVDGVIAQWTLQHTAAELEHILLDAEVPASRIYTIEDVFNDSHYRAREMLAQVPDDDFGTVTLVAPVPKLSRTPGNVRKSGGRIGRDTKPVLSRLLGYSDAELDALETARVLYRDRTE
jgi:crotonobetainyl-CoA:carnitine CoA-transferase CaiB-like acyl-CoA transferase